AIKFSSKDQTAASGAAAKPAKPVAAPKAGDATEAATDLFKSPADSKGETAKKK
ncbi:hypothetical protein EN984_24460, partial [Mesorhizobium sp. M7A.F.Ca.CA.004.12.1.1]